VWVVAANSTAGMFHADPNVFNVLDWDYRIVDGHIPARGASVGEQRLAVVSGMFDYNWRYADKLAVPGDTKLRAEGRVIRAPDRKLVVDPAVLAGYAGRFQINDGPEVSVRVADGKLLLKVRDEETELLPVGGSVFYVEENNLTLEFLRDDAGKYNELWGYNGSDFTGKRLP